MTAVPSPGHTPGHTAYLIASANDQLMIWGDTVHVPEVQTAFPEAGVAFDSDLALAAASRKRMFDRVAPMVCSLLVCTYISQPSRGWHGETMPMRSIRRRGSTRWIRSSMPRGRMRRWRRRDRSDPLLARSEKAARPQTLVLRLPIFDSCNQL